MFVDQILMFVLIAFEIEQIASAVADENVLPFATSNRGLIPKAKIQACESTGFECRSFAESNRCRRTGRLASLQVPSGELQHTGCDIERTDGPIVGFAARQLTGQTPNHRHANSAFAQHALLTDPGIIQRSVPAAHVAIDRRVGFGHLQRSTIVAGHDDECIVEQTVFVQFVDDSTHAVVDGRNHGQARIAAGSACRRGIDRDTFEWLRAACADRSSSVANRTALHDCDR